MEIDISIESILSNVKAIQQSIIFLHDKGQKSKKLYDTLKKQNKLIHSQMTWGEKHLMGLFGGDKDKVKRYKSNQGEIEKIHKILIDVDKQLKIKNERLHHEIIDYLKTNSPSYKKLVFYNSIFSELYDISASFYNLLLKAKEGITDALIFTSWDSLLNHPRAQGELNKFIEQISEYQKRVDHYEKSLNIPLLKGENLNDYIKFPTQNIAMDSLNRLSSRIMEIIDIANVGTKDNEIKIGTLIRNIKQKLVAIDLK
jgi:hypothetical protein